MDSRTVVRSGLLSETDCCPNMCSELISKKADFCPKRTVVRKRITFLNCFSLNICIGIIYRVAKEGCVTGYNSRDLIHKLNASYHAAEGRYLAA